MTRTTSTRFGLWLFGALLAVSSVQAGCQMDAPVGCRGPCVNSCKVSSGQADYPCKVELGAATLAGSIECGGGQDKACSLAFKSYLGKDGKSLYWQRAAERDSFCNK